MYVISIASSTSYVLLHYFTLWTLSFRLDDVRCYENMPVVYSPSHYTSTTATGLLFYFTMTLWCVTDTGTVTQLLLVTEYHELGSLFDFLIRDSVKNMRSLLKLCHSITRGLAHLHMEINGNLGPFVWIIYNCFLLVVESIGQWKQVHPNFQRFLMLSSAQS